jgi:hypothetical protein
MPSVTKRGKFSFKINLNSEILNVIKEVDVRTNWWDLVGFEIKFPSLYSGTISLIKIVADSTNESNREYKTDPPYVRILDDSIFSTDPPLLKSSKNDKLNIKSSAAINGIVEIIAHYDSGATKQFKRN